MPVNRNALLRYKTIDACLRNRRRKWTLDDLITAVSDALYEYEGMVKEISRRTVQADIQVMRSSRLGYNAPIIVLDKKYYTYEDPAYSITQLPLKEQDLQRMNEAVEMLRQFKGFSHFQSLNEVVQKLEDHVYAATHATESVIDFEKNEQLKGLNLLEPIYNAIIHRQPLKIRYQSFQARTASDMIFHPWWLKEFKNRWFVIGCREGHQFEFNLALDRIQELDQAPEYAYRPNTNIDLKTYYKDVIGVTVQTRQQPKKVVVWVDASTAPYIETKPLHPSQTVVQRTPTGIIIELILQLNFELEKELLGFGATVKVLSPQKLRGRMYQHMKDAVAKYQEASP